MPPDTSPLLLLPDVFATARATRPGLLKGLAMFAKEKFLADNDMLTTPPLPCDYAVGNRVMFTNDAGITFGPYRVIGFARTPSYGRFIHIDFDCAWFAVKPESLSHAN